MNKNLAVIILAAGKGKRMKSSLPKVLHSLHGRPMVEYVVEASKSLHPAKIVVVVGWGADEVKRALEGKGCSFVIQREQLGTAHAAMQAGPELNDFKGDILILCGDVPLIRPQSLIRLMEIHRGNRAAISFITTMLKDPSGYGRVIRAGEKNSSEGKVCAIREEKDASTEEKEIREINSGIYCMGKEFFLKNIGKIDCSNKQGEYYLTDLVEIAVKGSQPVHAFRAENPLEVLGINTLEELKKAEDALDDKAGFS